MEDLNEAVLKIQNVLRDIPRRARYILQSLNELKDLLPPPEKTEGISEKLLKNIEDIIDFMNFKYPNEDLLNDTINETTSVYPKLVELAARLSTYQELIISNERFKLMEQRFERIDSILPPYHFDFTIGVHDLEPVYITNEVFNDIKEAIKRFKNSEYPEVISYCGDASKRLTDKFATFLAESSEKTCSSSDWGPKLKEMENILETTKSPQNLSPKSRLEWFILSNLYIVLWLRNAYAHRSETDNRIPEWQNACRKIMVEDCNCARAAIVASLQAARYLQELLKNKNNP